MLRARQIDFLLCPRAWSAASLLWLNGAPASHTGARQILPSCLRGFPNRGCWQHSGWLHGNHEPSLDIPRVRLPRRALLSTEKKRSPEQKQNQTQARVGGGTIRSGRKGVLASCRAGSQVRGGAGVGCTFWDAARRPLVQGSPGFLPQACKKSGVTTGCGREAASGKLVPLSFSSWVQKRELGLTVLTVITYCGDKMTEASWPELRECLKGLWARHQHREPTRAREYKPTGHFTGNKF